MRAQFAFWRKVVSKHQVTFFISSFNRGTYLANCVHSVQSCVPNSRIHVLDDGSTDPDTIGVLSRLRVPITDISLETRWEQAGSRGGLSRGLNFAVHELTTTPIVVLLQDDMQIVRPIASAEILKVAEALRSSPKAFAYYTFLKESRELVAYHDNVFGWHFPEGASGYGFAAASMVDVKKVQSAGFEFGEEKETSRRAAERWGPMPILRDPFAMFLPWPQSFRSRSKTIAHRVWEASGPTGFVPWETMQESDISRLITRPDSEHAVADYYLTPSRAVRYPLRYNGLGAAPRVIRVLSEVELRMRAWMRSFRR